MVHSIDSNIDDNQSDHGQSDHGQFFRHIVGQSQAVTLLIAAIRKSRIAPAYLFAGVSGVGRAMTALAFAQCLLGDRKSGHRISEGNHPDVLWVEPTYLDKGKMLTAKEAEAAGLKRKTLPQIRLEQIRGIAEFVSRPPLESSRSLVIIDEAQTMTEAPANALLKTLEEPRHATIILIAPDVGSVLPTLVSRCQKIPFCRLDQNQMSQILQGLGYENLPPEVLALGQGSVGNAITAYEQFQAIPPDLLESVRQIPATPRQALTLAKEITQGLEVETQLWLLDYLQVYFWQRFTNQSHSRQGNNMEIHDLLEILQNAHRLIGRYVQPRLVWEVTLLRLGGWG
ncbi:MAG: DNA polymerase III subunit delta' [Pseudanabaenaceae cyanobacterium]